MADTTITLGLDDKALIAQGKTSAKKLGDSLARETERGILTGADKGFTVLKAKGNSVFRDMGGKAEKALFSKFLGAAAIIGQISSMVSNAIEAQSASRNSRAETSRGSGPASVRADLAVGRMGLPQEVATNALGAMGDRGADFLETLASKRFKGQRATTAISAASTGLFTDEDAMKYASNPSKLSQEIARRRADLGERSKGELDTQRKERSTALGIAEATAKEGEINRIVAQRVQEFKAANPIWSSLEFDFVRENKERKYYLEGTTGTPENNKILKARADARELYRMLVNSHPRSKQNLTGTSDRAEP